MLLSEAWELGLRLRVTLADGDSDGKASAASVMWTVPDCTDDKAQLLLGKSVLSKNTTLPADGWVYVCSFSFLHVISLGDVGSGCGCDPLGSLDAFDTGRSPTQHSSTYLHLHSHLHTLSTPQQRLAARQSLSSVARGAQHEGRRQIALEAVSPSPSTSNSH